MLPSGLEHIAIIMDGNGRWATQRGLSRSEGHKAGVKVFTTILEECITIGLPILTVYAFSKENWRRSRKEVNALFTLLLHFIKKEIGIAIEKNIRIQFLGDMEGLPSAIQEAITYATQKTQENTGLQCNIAFNYSAQEEIIQACKRIAKEYQPIDSLDIDTFKSYLYTKNMNDPDLIIRTGGEYRMSNFLLFQSAYSELYFSSLLWPDFTKQDLHNAIMEFTQRKRRFGA